MIIAVCFSLFLYLCKHLKIIYIFRQKQEKRFFTESWGIGKKINYDLAVHLICDFMMSSAIKSFGQAFLKSLRSREAEPFVARRNGRNPLMLQKSAGWF